VKIQEIDIEQYTAAKNFKVVSKNRALYDFLSLLTQTHSSSSGTFIKLLDGNTVILTARHCVANDCGGDPAPNNRRFSFYHFIIH
jgi:hypothetical protein